MSDHLNLQVLPNITPVKPQWEKYDKIGLWHRTIGEELTFPFKHATACGMRVATICVFGRETTQGIPDNQICPECKAKQVESVQ